MTKVNVRKGGYGEYLFYRMQVLHDSNRDVYILFTRWGRIGEPGAYQNTPFSHKDECINEFKKIFEQKSKNKWDDKDNFERVEGKYRLLDIDTKKQVKRRDYLKSIDFDDKHLPKSKLAPEIQPLMKIFGNVDLYRNWFKTFNIDSEVLPFGQISKKLIHEAKDILNEIDDLIKENQEAKTAKGIDTDKVRVL